MHFGCHFGASVTSSVFRVFLSALSSYFLSVDHLSPLQNKVGNLANSWWCPTFQDQLFIIQAGGASLFRGWGRGNRICMYFWLGFSIEISSLAVSHGVPFPPASCCFMLWQSQGTTAGGFVLCHHTSTVCILCHLPVVACLRLTLSWKCCNITFTALHSFISVLVSIHSSFPCSDSTAIL